MIWNCYKNGSHIACRDFQGLLIRGIPESMIFEVEAETQIEAKNKAAEIIKQVKKRYEENYLSGTRMVQL